uniref:Uncharacterized protein n=1 Tax=Physcomitrium patens TaxID=3218 RepID=A0A7I3ZPJ1_PHYPA
MCNIASLVYLFHRSLQRSVLKLFTISVVTTFKKIDLRFFMTPGLAMLLALNLRI